MSEKDEYGYYDVPDGGYNRTAQGVGQRSQADGSIFVNPQHDPAYILMVFPSFPQAMNPRGIIAPPRGLSPKGNDGSILILAYTSGNVATNTDPLALKTMLQATVMLALSPTIT